jgi:hypothetical protein
VPVAFLGDNRQQAQWAKHLLKPADIPPVFFSAAHGRYIDSEANIYIPDWNHVGRLTKLARSL